jgi:hypothetical protein
MLISDDAIAGIPLSSDNNPGPIAGYINAGGISAGGISFAQIGGAFVAHNLVKVPVKFVGGISSSGISFADISGSPPVLPKATSPVANYVNAGGISAGGISFAEISGAYVPPNVANQNTRRIYVFMIT